MKLIPVTALAMVTILSLFINGCVKREYVIKDTCPKLQTFEFNKTKREPLKLHFEVKDK